MIKQVVKDNEKQRYFMIKQKKEDKKCTDRSIHDFPEDLFTYEQRRHGAVILHAFLGLYCFLLTAFVCHDYLLPAVDRICISLNISTDVAGATFLAMASSFPELFVNVIGTFLTESDLGAGTVVGSAVFDTFATPACGALMTFYVSVLFIKIYCIYIFENNCYENYYNYEIENKVVYYVNDINIYHIIIFFLFRIIKYMCTCI